VKHSLSSSLKNYKPSLTRGVDSRQWKWEFLWSGSIGWIGKSKGGCIPHKQPQTQKTIFFDGKLSNLLRIHCKAHWEDFFCILQGQISCWKNLVTFGDTIFILKFIKESFPQYKNIKGKLIFVLEYKGDISVAL
jgi:hypothetical protein